MKYLLQGLTMGLAYVAPIGMQNMYIMNSALTRTTKMAYVTAFIVLAFDVTLTFAGYFGMGTILETWPVTRLVVLLVGSLLVIYTGISLLRDKGNADRKVDVNIPLLKIATSAFAVSWLNPPAVIGTTMLFGATRASLPPGTAKFFLWGVISASCIWFTGLTTLLHFFQKRFSPKIIRWINILSGIILIFYGGKLFLQFVELVRK
ncbi:MAG: LysE family transporter [Fusobacteriaceae bacterium]|jgi:L-lysine exporter family protein LysE/ArgO|nr:LysE family transporter [Fusobacteriaceae bacterium]